MEENCLTQLVRETSREGSVTREGLVGDVVVEGHLGHSDHGTIQLSVLGEGGGLDELLLWSFGGQILACLGHGLTESFGKQS